MGLNARENGAGFAIHSRYEKEYEVSFSSGFFRHRASGDYSFREEEKIIFTTVTGVALNAETSFCLGPPCGNVRSACVSPGVVLVLLLAVARPGIRLPLGLEQSAR